MDGGIYFVELTINETSTLWHPHLHVLFAGDFMPHRTACDEWLSCTGDSYIIHLAGIRDSDHAAGYVAKYASKAVPSCVWQSPIHFHEAILAFAGRRLFSTFGTFKNLDLSKCPADDIGWDCVAPLFSIILLSRRGVRYARQIMDYLTHGESDESIDVHDTS